MAYRQQQKYEMRTKTPFPFFNDRARRNHIMMMLSPHAFASKKQVFRSTNSHKPSPTERWREITERCHFFVEEVTQKRLTFPLKSSTHS